MDHQRWASTSSPSHVRALSVAASLGECDASARAALASGDWCSALSQRDALQGFADSTAMRDGRRAADEHLRVRAYGNAMVTCCAAAERLLHQEQEQEQQPAEAAAAPLEGVLSMFRDMKESGLSPDLRCANAALRATLLLDRRAEVQSLFALLFEQPPSSIGQRPLEPDSFSYMVVLSACRSSSSGQEARGFGRRPRRVRRGGGEHFPGATEALRLVAEMERRHDEELRGEQQQQQQQQRF